MSQRILFATGFSRDRTRRGFSLIELMIVVAIIAALAALALPRYQSYLARVQFAEALSLFAGVRTAIEAHVAVRGVDDSLAEEDFLALHRTAGDYVEGITVGVDGGTVEVVAAFKEEEINPELQDAEVVFSWAPGDDPNAVWTCAPDDAIQPFATGLCAVGY